MHNTAKNILAQHRRTLNGRLVHKRLHSHALGIAKPFFVYEPPDLTHHKPLPVLYLFRGHEREWVNLREDRSRRKSTAIEDLDRMIVSGLIPPLLVVMPGLNSSNNWIPSLGIDMVGRWQSKFRGLGSGQFWTYFTEELLPAIDRRYPATTAGPKLMAGFSLGGYTVSLLAAKLPGFFSHAAIYDGTLMWPEHRDPRFGRQKNNDRIWCRSPLFDAALGKPRNRKAMRTWNSTSMILHADAAMLHKLQKTKFWVASAARDGGFGNRDRAQAFVKMLKRHSIRTGFRNIIFDPAAEHTWHWTDRFLATFLLKATAHLK